MSQLACKTSISCRLLCIKSSRIVYYLHVWDHHHAKTLFSNEELLGLSLSLKNYFHFRITIYILEEDVIEHYVIHLRKHLSNIAFIDWQVERFLLFLQSAQYIATFVLNFRSFSTVICSISVSAKTKYTYIYISETYSMYLLFLNQISIPIIVILSNYGFYL